MEFQEIEVVIDKDGKVRIEVNGVKGPGCLDITKALEQALGGDIESREMRPEFDEEAGQGVQRQQTLGSDLSDDWA